MGLFGGGCNNDSGQWIWIAIIIVLIFVCGDGNIFGGRNNNCCCDPCCDPCCDSHRHDDCC